MKTIDPTRGAPRSWLSGIRVKLLLCFLVIGVAPAAVVAGIALWEGSARLVDSSAGGLMVQAVAVGDKIDRNLFERYGDVQAFAFSPLARGTPAEATAAADFFMKTYGIYDLMVVADLDGRIVAANTVDAAGSPLDTRRLIGRSVRGEPWFEEIASGRLGAGKSFYGDLSPDPWVRELTGGEGLALNFSAPVFDAEGRLLRVWSNRASWARTAEQIAEEQHEELERSGVEVEVLVVSKTGLLLTAQHSRDQALKLDLGKAGVAAISDAWSGKPGYTREEMPGRHGEQLVVHAQTDGALGFPGYGWIVLISANVNDVLAGVDALRRHAALVLGISVLLIATIAFLLSRSISAPLIDTARALDAISQGDLRVQVEVTARDEVGTMRLALNRAVQSLAEIVRQARSASTTIAASAEELTTNSRQMSENAESTASRANSVSAAAEQVSRGVDTVASGSEEMTAAMGEIAKNAAAAAATIAEGADSARLARASVTQLEASSIEIGKVSDTIKSIAEKTNELAGVARAQADRAEGASKGFAAVANEVKDLARQTSLATEQIGGRIDAIQSDTADAVTSLATIGESIGRIDGLITRIEESLRQTTGTRGEDSLGEVARLAKDAVQSAQGAVATVAEIDRRVQQLGKSSGEVSEVVRVIETIARQTKLLSLNATIEAQRAGDAALGFGGVADRVKTLARQTAEATAEIRGRIDGVQGEAQGAVTAVSAIAELVDRVAAISGAMARAVDEQKVAVDEIARSVTEAATGSQEIAQDVTNVAELAQGAASGASAALAAAGDLARLATELDASLSRFQA